MRKVIKESSSEVISPDTGEIVRTTHHALIVDNKPRDRDFIKVFKAFTSSVLQDLEIENGKAKLLIWFMDRIQGLKPSQEHIIVAGIDEIAKDLNCSEVAVRKWLAFLISKDYIHRYLKSTGKVVRDTYVVNKQYMFRGVVSAMGMKNES